MGVYKPCVVPVIPILGMWRQEDQLKPSLYHKVNFRAAWATWLGGGEKNQNYAKSQKMGDIVIHLKMGI